jgi:exonuclease VII large subunit
MNSYFGNQPCVPLANPALSNTKRFSRQKNWTRPQTTETDDINQNKEKIREKLENYVEAENIDFVSQNTHIRYFVFDTRVGDYRFRLGGLLAMKHSSYVVLSNGSLTWSVPKESEYEGKQYKTKFFRVLTPYEMQEKKATQNEKEKDKTQVVAQQQSEQLQRQQDEIDKLKRVIMKLSSGNTLTPENETVVSSAKRNVVGATGGRRTKNV